MTEPITPVVAQPDPTPVVTEAPKSAAVVTPAPAVPAAEAKLTPDSKATSKSLLDQAGEEKSTEVVKIDVGALHDKAVAAFEAWKNDPTPENEALANEAMAEMKKGITDSKLPDPPPAVVVPEKYEFKMPEGVELDPSTAEAFTPVLKEAKLTQAQVDQLMPVYASAMQKAVETYEKAQETNYHAFIKAQQEETVKALGAKWKEELTYAAKVKERFFSADTLERVNKAGLGDNIHFLRDLMKLGKAISEDKLVEGANLTEQSGGTAGKLFTTMKA